MQAKQTEIDRRFQKLVDQTFRVVTVIQALRALPDDEHEEVKLRLVALAEDLSEKLPDDLERCQMDYAEYADHVTKEWRKSMDEVVDYRTGRKTAAGGGQ